MNKEFFVENRMELYESVEPVTREPAFENLTSLKVDIGNGSVICMANDLLPVDEKNWYVPVWLI